MRLLLLLYMPEWLFNWFMERDIRRAEREALELDRELASRKRESGR